MAIPAGSELRQMSSLRSSHNLAPIHWTDYFSLKLDSFRDKLLENHYSALGDKIPWTNYFDEESGAFKDFFTEEFLWTKYFGPCQYFPEGTAFPCKEDWAQLPAVWDDLLLGNKSFSWKTLPDLLDFKVFILMDEEKEEYDLDDLLSDIALEFEVDSVSLLSEGTPDLDMVDEGSIASIYEMDSNVDLEMDLDRSPSIGTYSPSPTNNSDIEQNMETFILTQNQKPSLEKRATFLTPKRYEWLTPAWTAIALAKFSKTRRNIFDPRETKSAGSEPNIPEIIEPRSPGTIEMPKIQESANSATSLNSENLTGLLPLPQPPKILTALKPFDPNKMGRNRPHSSQGLYFVAPEPDTITNNCQNLPNSNQEIDPFLLQVPSTYNGHRRTSEPSLALTLPVNLPPPRRLKTPEDFAQERFWATKKRQPWDHFEKSGNSRSKTVKPIRKLKQIPISRCRSAMDKPTSFDIDELANANSRTNLVQNSPKRLSNFRFRRNSCRVSPEPLANISNVFNADESLVLKSNLNTRQGIHSKVKAKKPRSRAKLTFFKRKEWAPLIRNLLRGSIIIHPESSAKILPNTGPSGGLDNNGYEDEANSQAPQIQYNVIKYKDVIRGDLKNGQGSQSQELLTILTQPKTADPRRRRPYWIRLLRYCNIRKRFGIRRSMKNISQGNRVYKIKK